MVEESGGSEREREEKKESRKKKVLKKEFVRSTVKKGVKGRKSSKVK